MSSNKTRKLGRYEFLTRIATGGMAEIHLARQLGIEGFERLVVLKLIHPHLADEERFVEMFLDEARIAARLNHPNIVQIYDFGKEEDKYFIAMEYLEGESLGTIVKAGLESDASLDQHLAAGIIAQVCDGLDYAHKFVDISGQAMQIVHRDVSPQNIIALYSGTVKVVDFGIAKAASKIHKTRSGTLKGKLTYMSPEQCKAKPVDARTDVFSLGAVFWEMLSLHRLFKRESEAAMIDAIVNEPIANPMDLRRGLLPGYAEIAMTALQRDPKKRFQSAAAMATAIRAVLHQTNHEAGAPEIGKYIRSVLGGRQKAKQELLMAMVKSNGKPEEFKFLKPDTDESIPRGASTKSLTLQDSNHPLPTEDATLPEDKKKSSSKARLWILTGGLVFAIFAIASIVLLLTGSWKHAAGVEPDHGSSDHGDGGTFDQVALIKDSQLAALRDREEKAETDDAGQPGSWDAGLVKQYNGSLDVVSDPRGCRVELDGIPVPGRTPIEKLQVSAASTHQVSVFCKGQGVSKQSFQVAADGHKTLRFMLKSRQKGHKRKKRKKPAMGFLRLDTTPWSIVYLGKRKLGMTPLVDLELPAGVHHLRAVNKEKGLSKLIEVHIEPAKSTSIQYTF